MREMDEKREREREKENMNNESRRFPCSFYCTYRYLSLVKLRACFPVLPLLLRPHRLEFLLKR